MQTIKVWDPLVRLFHWSLVIGFVLDAVILDEDSRLHEQVGYVVLGLIGARLVWGGGWHEIRAVFIVQTIVPYIN